MGEVLALLDAGRGGEDDCTPPRWESIELACECVLRMGSPSGEDAERLVGFCFCDCVYAVSAEYLLALSGDDEVLRSCE